MSKTITTRAERIIYDEMWAALATHTKSRRKFYPLRMDEYDKQEREIKEQYSDKLDNKITHRNTREKKENEQKIQNDKKKHQENLEKIAVAALLKLSGSGKKKTTSEKTRFSERIRKQTNTSN